MTTTTSVDRFTSRVAAGERLSSAELAELAATSDILALGMLGDTARRRLHGARTTFLRVAQYPVTAGVDEPVPAGAREVRLTGAPVTIDAAVEAVTRARSAAGDRTLSAFSWIDIERLAADATDRANALERLRRAGLDGFAELPLDEMADPAAVVEALAGSGFDHLRLTVARAASSGRHALFLGAAEVQDRYGCVQAIAPLPLTLGAFRPTTGYEDVKMVALARVAAPNVPTIQVDWLRYGPKLAQVALTFGADDIDGISPSDAAPEGRRRRAVEEIRRNIEVAGLDPAERDGRFALLG